MRREDRSDSVRVPHCVSLSLQRERGSNGNSLAEEKSAGMEGGGRRGQRRGYCSLPPLFPPLLQKVAASIKSLMIPALYLGSLERGTKMSEGWKYEEKEEGKDVKGRAGSLKVSEQKTRGTRRNQVNQVRYGTFLC